MRAFRRGCWRAWSELFIGGLMEHQTQQSCWGVMAWTVAALVGVMLLIGLLGGFDATNAVAAR